MNIRIGTRGSKLALWQAQQIADLLTKGGLDPEIVPITTKGDMMLDTSISKIGSKGVFTEEIEHQLAGGHIDIAVHSAKDLQSELPDGFELIAFAEREIENDVLVSSTEDLSLEKAPEGTIIGTSSTRRIALLKHHFPNLQNTPVRGNVETRIAKMKEGACHGLILAYAGVVRMGFGSMIVQELSLDKFFPPAGQGSIAVETYQKIDPEVVRTVRELINDPLTEGRIEAERAFLKQLQGGCSIPAFANAQYDQDAMTITGGVISLDGRELVKRTLEGPADDPVALGESVAKMVLENGGSSILEDIKNEV